MKKITTSLALLLAVVTLTNCSSKGFETSSSIAGSSDQSGQGTGDGAGSGGGTGGGSTTSPLDNIDLQGKVDGDKSDFGGALSFDFDKARGEFIIMVPMPSGVVITPPPGVFSKYPDITFSPIWDATTGKMKMGVRIPVKYIIKGMSTLPAARLPNGDPLPAMPSGYGELPSLGLSFPQHNNLQISLYVGVNAIGLYVTLPTNAALPIGFTLPIRNKDKTKTYGYLTYVPAKMNHAPGLFVSTVIPPSVSRILEDYFKL